MRRQTLGIHNVSLWLSIAAVLIALFAAFVGYAVYRSQADPDVIVFAEGDETRASIINLVIENVGKAPARDVSFKPSRTLPRKAYGTSLEEAQEPQEMHDGPIVRGIPLLPPGGRRVITWGQYWGLTNALGDDPVWVVINYTSKHFGIPWPIRHSSRCPLEVFSFAATDASDKNFQKQIADNLQALTKVIEKRRE